VLRWDGTSWSRTKSPDPSTSFHENILYGVSAPSATDAWAVGDYQSDATDLPHPLATGAIETQHPRSCESPAVPATAFSAHNDEGLVVSPSTG